MSPRWWPGLILAPIFALADQTVAYSLLEWSCAVQKPAVPHIAHAVFLMLTLVTLFMAWGHWQDRPAGKREDAPDAATRKSTFGIMATLVAALSGLVIVAMWYPHLVLAPCHG
jgi:hypothetical protein